MRLGFRAMTAAAAVWALTATAGAAPHDPGATPLERAKEESPASSRAPKSKLLSPAGAVWTGPSELLAAAGQDIVVNLDVTGDPRGTLIIEPPAAFEREAAGHRATGAPRLAGAAGTSRLVRDGRRIAVRLAGVRDGDVLQVRIPDHGLPAGTYDLGVSHAAPGAAARDLGRIQVRLYAPVREAGAAPNEWAQVRDANATADTFAESETFVTVSPRDGARVLVGANIIASGQAYSAWLSTDGGATYARRPVPQLLDVPAGDGAGEPHTLCCDPISAANPEGDLWYGGLSTNVDDEGFIVVNRIAAGETSFRPLTVALPRRNRGIQDKPMMTIDNSPSSPTYGRLYVVWNEPGSGGGINVVATQCDTRPGGGSLDAARCDEADNWTDPVDVTDGEGSYIYADPAVAHDGTLHVVWWDFSVENAIRGASCSPAQGADCASAAGFGAIKTIARLDFDNVTGDPVPFACPTLAQPGGRTGPSPGVETDISNNAPTRGRVYVTWGDLADDGTTRCAENFDGTGTPPLSTHDAWNVFVASASNALPGSDAPSTTVGTRLVTDASENTGGQRSDEWFPWLGVDQRTGAASAGFYSTRDDSTRRTSHFYLRPVTTGGLGTLQRVSDTASDYSTSTCCEFGNDYGDYTGTDAACGFAFPVWSSKQGSDDGEAMLDRVPVGNPVVCLAAAGAQITEVAGLSDGDGLPEPSETVDLLLTVRNAGSAASDPATTTLSTTGPGTVLDGTATFPGLAPGATAVADRPYRVRLERALSCGATLPLTATAQAGSTTTALVTGIRAGGQTGVCRTTPTAALALSTASASTGQSVILDAGGSADPDGQLTRFDWDFDGNGVIDQTTTTASTVTAYATAGTFAPKVRVVDDEGDAAEATSAITVTAAARRPVAPTVALVSPTKARRMGRTRRIKLTVLTCARCTGSIVLKSTGRVRVGSRRRILSLGTVRFTAPASGRVTVTWTVSKANAAIVRRLRNVATTATLKALSPEGLSGKSTARFRLRR